jgi:SPP1 family predicted phage head-tail adaptor
MNTNDLNKSIVVEKETTSINANGTPIETYQFLKESYAGMTLRSGETQYSDMGALPFNNVEFLIRYDERINYKCRFKYEGQYYRIKHIQVLGRQDWMLIRAIVWEE